MRALLILGLVVALAGCGRVDVVPRAIAGQISAPAVGRTVADLQHQADQDAAQLAADRAALGQAQQQEQQAWIDRLAYATLAAAVLAAAAAGVIAYLHGPSVFLALEVAGCLAVAGVALLETSHYLPMAGPWLLAIAGVALGGRWLIGHVGSLKAFARREEVMATATVETVAGSLAPLVPGVRRG